MVQFELFNVLGINHATAIVLAKFNENFLRVETTPSKRQTMKGNERNVPGKNGTFHTLDFEMAQTALPTTVELVSEVHQEVRVALVRQKENKWENKETLLKKCLGVATKLYIQPALS